MALKEYSQLTFTDDFMFCKVLYTNKDLCKELLELILDIKIADIDFIDDQVSFKQTYEGRGIRLDVYAEDNDRTVYDIEMQTTLKGNLPKRSRYYQSMIDLNQIEKGASFSSLKPTYIIFICLDDPFGKGLPVYHFSNLCRDDSTLEMGDDTVKVFINAKGDRSGLSQNMSDFLDYLLLKTINGDFTKRIQSAVEQTIEHKEWRTEYMKLALVLEEEREEGRQEGRGEGENLKLISMVCKKLKKGKDSSIIADELEETIEVIDRIIEKTKDPTIGFDEQRILEALNN